MEYPNLDWIGDSPSIKLKNVLNFLDSYFKLLGPNINPDKICCTARSQKVFIPTNLTPKLAYFVGYFQGDGHLGCDKKRMSFTDETKEQMERVNLLLWNLFSKKGRIIERLCIKSTKPHFSLRINQKVISAFMHQFFGLPFGVKNNLRIPAVIWKNKTLLKWYLSGLFDADGTLPKNAKKTKSPFLDIASKDLSLMNDVYLALKKLGINSYKPYKKFSKSPNSNNITVTWELRIRKCSEIKRFLSEIGFYHPDKSIRMLSLYQRVNMGR